MLFKCTGESWQSGEPFEKQQVPVQVGSETSLICSSFFTINKHLCDPRVTFGPNAQMTSFSKITSK